MNRRRLATALGCLLRSRAVALLLASLAIGPAMASTLEQRLSEPPGLVFSRGEEETALKTQFLMDVFGEEDFDWNVDLEAGTISFSSPSVLVTAPVQVIGTYNTLDGTFLWGWDHPSVPKARGAHARLAHRFGERNHLPLFTQRKVTCTEQEAWAFTTAALYLAGAHGAYRGPSDTVLVFMTFGTMKIERAR